MIFIIFRFIEILQFKRYQFRPAIRAGWLANIKYAYPEGAAAAVVADVGQSLVRAHLLWTISAVDD
jgi:hypothetical protein